MPGWKARFQALAIASAQHKEHLQGAAALEPNASGACPLSGRHAAAQRALAAASEAAASASMAMAGATAALSRGNLSAARVAVAAASDAAAAAREAVGRAAQTSNKVTVGRLSRQR